MEILESNLLISVIGGLGRWESLDNVKVVTFLTMPIDPESDNHALQVEVMHDVKDAFLAQDALAVVVALVSRPLMRHADGHMSDRDVLIVQLVVTFLRNLIVIPDSGSSSGSSGSHKSRMSSKLLCRLHEDSVLELLLVMAQHTSRADAPLLLEIFAALFNHCDAEVLRKHEPKAATLPKTSLHEVQQPTPTPNQRARLAPTSTEDRQPPRMDSNALLILKGFAEQFLSSSYNLLMGGLRRDLEPGLNISRLSEEDFLRFFKVAGFFTCFVRQQQEEVQKTRQRSGVDGTIGSEESPFAYISATMGWEMFYLVQSHASLALLKEMLFTLDIAQRTEAGGFLVQRRTAAARRRKASKQSEAVLEPGSDHEEKAATSDGTDQGQSSPTAAAGDTAAPAATPATPATPLRQAGHASSSEHEVSSAAKKGRDKDPLEQLLEEEGEDQQELEHRLKEVACDLRQRVRQELAFPAIVHFYTWLLQGYATNSRFVNHCLITFLQRIADPDGLNLEPMLYQVSVLRVLHQVLSDAPFRKQPGASEVLSFAARIVRSVIAKLVPGPADEDACRAAADEGEDGQMGCEKALQKGLAAMMFVELLFWKNAHDSEEVRDEYHWKATYRKEQSGAGEDAEQSDASGSDAAAPHAAAPQGQRRKRARSAIAFSADDSTLLVDLFEKHGNSKGYVDLIRTDMSDRFKRSQIQRQLKALGLKKGQLTDRQKGELQRLFHAHKGKRDSLAKIAAELPGQLSKGQIRTQLRRLGLQLKQSGAGQEQGGGQRSDSEDSSRGVGNLFSDASASHTDSEASSDQVLTND
ncbi:hypothetical protein COCSUDRAFT_58046 [Coccomyxa subellipsoidea C-169]|uniref:Timeless N-terminal domain-containing protein n=1 Tax=Coccomyxa subellipsoidea (strain C-169) TaxID=574566 RepID=I0YPM0_COCSC|nr:hypothetical protein COCSUDRAFT_58046 [Coccomyxa subellipsoidea C-169]EIE20339.1 hypothetical protein COCSUDRAFT_58046 [Coccomyxa subellipsoidea C-169]|eukprot:XP_005644883.1 hypothetical protein COCSUDRAFT_58046 [Coccomyxa subellipsoidea C-169]